MKVIPYNKEYKDRWDEFVKTSKNGTIFNSRQFLSYHPEDRFEDCSLLFEHKKDIVAVFPAARVNNDVLKSHPGASYGGPILGKGCGISGVIDVIDGIIEYAYEEGFSVIETRLSPRIFHKYPSEELEYILWYKGFEVENVELSSAVQLIFETEESIIENMRYNTKQPARKAAENGVVFKETDDYDIFWSILKSNLQKHNAKPTHSLEDMKTLKGLIPDSVKLFGSYKGDVMIAGTLVFITNDIACHTFYIAQDYDYQGLRPLNHLLSEVVKWAHANSFRFLNFGISTEAGGTIVNPGLFRFKEGFGAKGVVRRYYRKNLLGDEV